MQKEVIAVIVIVLNFPTILYLYSQYTVLIIGQKRPLILGVYCIFGDFSALFLQFRHFLAQGWKYTRANFYAFRMSEL